MFISNQLSSWIKFKWISASLQHIVQQSKFMKFNKIRNLQHHQRIFLLRFISDLLKLDVYISYQRQQSKKFSISWISGATKFAVYQY